jgi:hypothetical protein
VRHNTVDSTTEGEVAADDESDDTDSTTTTGDEVATRTAKSYLNHSTMEGIPGSERQRQSSLIGGLISSTFFGLDDNNREQSYNNDSSKRTLDDDSYSSNHVFNWNDNNLSEADLDEEDDEAPISLQEAVEECSPEERNGDYMRFVNCIQRATMPTITQVWLHIVL